LAIIKRRAFREASRSSAVPGRLEIVVDSRSVVAGHVVLDVVLLVGLRR
jgi:hypothetical protein